MKTKNKQKRVEKEMNWEMCTDDTITKMDIIGHYCDVAWWHMETTDSEGDDDVEGLNLQDAVMECYSNHDLWENFITPKLQK